MANVSSGLSVIFCSALAHKATFAQNSEFSAKATFVGKYSHEQFVQFVDVNKSYDGSINVVDGLNLNVRRGEFLTMLGPSGSGKTTCLIMLAGFDAVTSGDVLIEGFTVNPVFARYFTKLLELQRNVD